MASLEKRKRSLPPETALLRWTIVVRSASLLSLFHVKPIVATGGCILQYWNYSAASKPCKCPMCSSSITKLMPEAALIGRRDEEVKKVLENVQRYNCLFVGGVRGLLRKLCESPLFIKRIFGQIMDPDAPDSYLHEMRLVAMIMSILYAATPFQFIPTGSLGIVRLFDYAAIALFVILRLVGIFRRRWLLRCVRQMAATQPFGE